MQIPCVLVRHTQQEHSQDGVAPPWTLPYELRPSAEASVFLQLGAELFLLFKLAGAHLASKLRYRRPDLTATFFFFPFPMSGHVPAKCRLKMQRAL